MPRLLRIDDPGDPRIAPYMNLRDRDLAGAHGGRFIAEGEVPLRALLLAQERFPVDSLLVSEKRIGALGALIAGLPCRTPVHVAPQGVMDRIVGFPIHRGLLALASRGQPQAALELLAGLSPHALVVALVGVANHDNVGGVFRNAAAFGAEGVLLDGGSCDPLYRKAIRVSVGASLLVPFARGGDPADMLDALEGAGFETVALSPGGPEPISRLSRRGRTALLLGAEGSGLPQAVLARARAVRIAMRAGFDSLNLATASGIALHHLAEEHDPAEEDVSGREP